MRVKINKFNYLILSLSPILFVTFGMYISRVCLDLIPGLTAPQENNRVLGIESKVSIPKIPVRLKIPVIKVDASIENINILPNGEMGVPQNPLNVGWFQVDSSNVTGNVVIAGHLDQPNGEDGVFANLHLLKPGDEVFVEGNNGELITFVVKETKLFTPGYADEVFGSIDGPHLNLVTCEGTWNNIKKSYNKRLVVFTDLKD